MLLGFCAFRSPEVLLHLREVVVNGLPELFPSRLDGSKPILDGLLTLLGEPGGLIQEHGNHLLRLALEHGHGVEGIVEARLVEVQHLFYEVLLVDAR